MDSALVHKITVILISVFGVWLAFWVYLTDKKSKVNRYFFLMVASWLATINLYYWMMWVAPFERSLFVFKLGIASIFCFLIFFYAFSVYFLGEEKKFRMLNKLVPILGIAGAFLGVFSNFLAKGIEIAEYGRNPLLTPAGKIVFFGYVIFMVFFIIGRFFKHYLKGHPEQRLRIQYILMGLFLFVVINLYINVFLWITKNTLKYAYIGLYSVIFIFFFTSFAIVKQQLFGIKIVLIQLLVGIMGAVLLVVPFLTQTTWFRTLLFAVFFLFSIIGYLLIRYTFREAKQKEVLEQKVQERTKEIEERKNELEKFYKLTVGRELKMIELKEKIKEIEKKKGG